MLIRTLHHVNLIVDDLEKARAFYANVLGLPIRTDRPAEMPPGYWFDIGDRRLSIIPGKTARDGTVALEGYHFALVVEDLEQALAELRAANLELTVNRNPLLQIMLKDPAGNWIELRQPPEAYLTYLAAHGDEATAST